MEQLEKVCKGLQTAADSDWMWRKADYIAMCCKDAIALIRQQQERIKELEAGQMARVMTLEEVENAIDTVVWVEEPGFENSADYYALIMACNHKTGFVRVYFGFAEMPVAWGYKYEDYDKKWRCWTQRPTDEQRKAAKWE